MSDYILRFTDPARGSFVVKPYTTNGPDTPRNTAPLDSDAVSANTSLVMLGKGLPEYGDRIQENLLHLLEHFANKVRPAYPIQGQLWFKNENYVDPTYPLDPTVAGLYVYDMTSWINVPVSGKTSTNLDLSGFKLTNIGNPTVDTDATNKGFTDATYVALSGSTMGGVLNMGGFTITNLALPVALTDAVTKGFADDTYMSKTNAVFAGNLDLGGFKIVNLAAPTIGTDAVSKQFADSTYLAIAGGTVVGPLIASDGINMMLTNISDVGEPLYDSDAATKQYVDAAVFASTGGLYLPTTGGTLTGALIINDSSLIMNASDMNVSDASVTLSGNSTFSFSGTSFDMGGMAISNIKTQPLLASDAASKWYVDQSISRSVVHAREMFIADGVSTTFNLNAPYVVGSNSLSVSMNGIKQYATQLPSTHVTYNVPAISTHGYQSTVFPSATSATVAILTTAEYTFSVEVDGITLLRSVEIVAGRTFGELATDLTTALVGYATVYWSDSNNRFTFVSDATGLTSSILLSQPDVMSPDTDLWMVIMSNTLISMEMPAPRPGLVQSFEPDTPIVLPNTPYTFTVNANTPQAVVINIPSPVLTLMELVLLVNAALPTHVTLNMLPDRFEMQVNPAFGTHMYLTSDTLFSAVATALNTTRVIDVFGTTVPVTGASTTLNQFTVPGDYSAVFNTMGVQKFVVTGSTGNDGVWTVSLNATYALGATTIAVVETVLDNTADGHIVFNQAFAYSEVGDPLTVSTVVEFTTAPPAGSTLEVLAPIIPL